MDNLHDHQIADNAYTKLIVPGFKVLVMTLGYIDFFAEAVILWLMWSLELAYIHALS